MCRVLHELLPENRFEPGASRRSAAPPTGPSQEALLKQSLRIPTHRPEPDPAHPSNTIKGSLGKRPTDSVTSSSNSNRVKAVVVWKLLLLRHGAQLLSDGVFPLRALEHTGPAARNGQLSGNRGWGGAEGECYDRDAGACQGCWRMLPRRLCGRPRPGRTTATKTAPVEGGANRPDVPRPRLRR